jgi:hypothetical protein
MESNMTKKGKNLADFRGAHDNSVIVPAKIEAALAALEKEGGPENWEYEAQFIKRVGTSQTNFAAHRDKFKAHIAVVPGGGNPKRVWIASAKAAAKFRSVEGVSGVE